MSSRAQIQYSEGITSGSHYQRTKPFKTGVKPLHYTFYQTLRADPNCTTNRADCRRSMRYYQHGTGVRRRSMFTEEFNDLKAKVGFIALRQYIRRTVIHFLTKAKLRNGNKGLLSS